MDLGKKRPSKSAPFKPRGGIGFLIQRLLRHVWQSWTNYFSRETVAPAEARQRARAGEVLSQTEAWSALFGDK